MTTEMLLITSPSFIRAYHILFEINRSWHSLVIAYDEIERMTEKVIIMLDDLGMESNRRRGPHNNS